MASAGGGQGNLADYMAQLQQQAFLQQAALEEQRHWQRLLLRTLQMGESELRTALASPVAEVRFAAAYVVGEKGLPWHRDLLPLLEDRTEGVRQAARRGLIILAFLALNPGLAERLNASRPTPAPGAPRIPAPRRAGADADEPAPKPAAPAAPAVSAPATAPAPAAAAVGAPAQLVPAVDFGPIAGAKKASRTTSRKRWTEWWDARDPGLATTPSSARRPEAAPPSGEDPEQAARKLTDLPPGRRGEAIEFHRDTPGVQHTETLALAAARLTGDARGEVRDALVQRMTRMTDATLVRFLNDDDVEIRRAAALGLAGRKSVSSADRVIELLLDADPSVREAAHEALRQLSGQDFGPRPGAAEPESRRAAAGWRQWWAKK
jgi:hypothetical protein